MKKVLIGISVLCLLSALVSSASAAFVTFDFRNLNLGGQNTATMTVAGYELQVQAWTAQHNTGTNPWTTTQLGSSSITWTSGQGLGVSNSVAGAGTGELDTNLYSGNLGYQDWLSFKLLNPPTGTTNYTSITYSGLDEWLGNNNGEFSQARISTQSGGILTGGKNPLGSSNSTDQLGLALDPETLALPGNFINGDWYLLAGPRLSGINNSFTGGAGDSFLVAAVTMDIPGAVVPIPAAAWLFGTGIAGLAALKRKVRKK